ncbi:hypothetical protein, partial [Halorhodospira sp. 9622]|uniref:hypothetical protein n=1 Tax=Halorhodospira sp. 9622 TaxID=2899136 RepID=UPI001EE7F62E
MENVIIATGSHYTSNAVGTGGGPVSTELDLNWTARDSEGWSENLDNAIRIDGKNQVDQTDYDDAFGTDDIPGNPADEFQLFGDITLNNDGASDRNADVQLSNRDGVDGWLAMEQLEVN